MLRSGFDIPVTGDFHRHLGGRCDLCDLQLQVAAIANRFPSNSVITSPLLQAAFSAGLFGVTSDTSAPLDFSI